MCLLEDDKFVQNQTVLFGEIMSFMRPVKVFKSELFVHTLNILTRLYPQYLLRLKETERNQQPRETKNTKYRKGVKLLYLYGLYYYKTRLGSTLSQINVPITVQRVKQILQPYFSTKTIFVFLEYTMKLVLVNPMHTSMGLIKKTIIFFFFGFLNSHIHETLSPSTCADSNTNKTKQS